MVVKVQAGSWHSHPECRKTMSAYAGAWNNTSTGCQYQKDDGNYARAEWITENGTSYYLNQNGIMAVKLPRNTWWQQTAVGCPNSSRLAMSEPRMITGLLLRSRMAGISSMRHALWRNHTGQLVLAVRRLSLHRSCQKRTR